MSNPSSPKKRPAPLSIRLSETERRSLTERAGETALSAYVREQIFGEAASGRRSPRAVSVDRARAAQILSLLGETRISNNLNQLARHAHTGSLIFDDETRRDLKEACATVGQVRDLLMQALGKSPGASASPSASDAFGAAAGPGVRP
jgi:hypothetical protein